MAGKSNGERGSWPIFFCEDNRMLSIEMIRTRLSQHQPQSIAESFTRQAAVAMLLTPGEQGQEVLFIRRAEHDDDPWSGDVAFPGGGVEAQDSGAQQTAEREVREEIGFSLQPEHYLGQLDDLTGAYLSVRVCCFVYLLPEKPQLKLNGEVVDTFWVSLRELQSPTRRRMASFAYRGTYRTHPIISLEGYCEHFLWGMTY
ncbi:MAG: NUDIX domain-containing protein, partial [Desulfuromonadaceae bacterium]|nr:NUDIX domain-containing protein [Desulfuromonadaceae bacterium]